MRVRSLTLVVAVTLSALPLVHAQAPPKPVNHGGAPAVSPDGSRIAFVSDRDGASDLFVISADGTGEVRLTRTPESEGKPDWSADGKEIRYPVFANDVSRVYAVDAAGRNQRLLGSVPGRVGAISPDGTQILHWTGSWTAVRLFVSGIDGSSSRQLTDGSGVVWNTRWSPDGKRIAFTGRDATGVLHVYVMGADGSGLRQVTHFAPADGQAQVPAWSPNGARLAVQSAPKGQPGHVWIVDAGTGDARKLNPHEQNYVDEVPTWFPDGKRIAFQSNRTGSMEIWVANADGSGQRQITK